MVHYSDIDVFIVAVNCWTSSFEKGADDVEREVHVGKELSDGLFSSRLLLVCVCKAQGRNGWS